MTDNPLFCELEGFHIQTFSSVMLGKLFFSTSTYLINTLFQRWSMWGFYDVIPPPPHQSCRFSILILILLTWVHVVHSDIEISHT